MNIDQTVAEAKVPELAKENAFIAFLHRIGFTPLGLAAFIILALLPLIPPFNQEHILRWLVMGAFMGAQAVAFDFTTGYINVVNFGFAAILGVGAYTSAILSNTLTILAIHPGLPPWLTIWIGALVAGVVGFLLGLLTMMVLITYDVNTETDAGKKRLRRVARQCQNYGQRVQNSVFECLIDAGQLRLLKQSLCQIIDPEKDSLRFYYLGDNWHTRVEHVGAKPAMIWKAP